MTKLPGSVWAVLAFDSETIITGCADTKIRIFHISGKLLRSFAGSSDPVRALCKLSNGHPSGADFASASNDGIIRLWTISGKQVSELNGHEAFIYSLASTPSGELVSSGEDRTIRIWKGNECIQTITHPAISVWSVAVCPENGDIVSGASDRVARIFTRAVERAADTETTRQFQDAVKGSSIPQQQMGEVNKEKLPGPEFLTQKSGTKEGQVQMIRELDGSVTAHTWSVSAQQWVSVGTVVDAVGSSGKKVDYQGKEYDYVFGVNMEDGKPDLQLPYNLSENPYEAATKFIETNKLPISYLDQVANFITTNTQGATLGQTTDAPSGPGSDPWGSDNRYRPGGDTASTPAAARPKGLPQKDYLDILVARIPPMHKKIQELNRSLIDNGRKDVSLNPTEITILSNLAKHLESVGSTKSSQSVYGGLELAIKISTVWPYKDRLPGLDLLRLLAVAPMTAVYTLTDGTNIVKLLSLSVNEQQPPAENHVMMAVRAFGNLFATVEGRALATSEFDIIQSLVSSQISTSSTNRNLFIAITTLYINYAVYFNSNSAAASFEYVLAIIDSLGKILTTQVDSEVVFRALVAAGTLMFLGEEVRSAAKDVYGMEKSITKALGKAGEPRNKNVAVEITDLLNK